jgi:hypothetical protein
MSRARRSFFPAVVATLPALLLAWAAPAGAQSFDIETTQGREFTIEADTSRGKNAGKSLGLALAASAVLPGAGQHYLQEPRSARAFWLAEAGFWAGLFISSRVKADQMQSARHLASAYAGANAAGQGEAYLERLAVYRSYYEKEHRQDSYELAQVLAGQELEALEPWDFGSAADPENTARWDEYRSVMRHYRGAKVAMSFAVGGLVLNRVVAMAHTLRVYRRTSGKGLAQVSPPPYRFVPEFGPEYSALKLHVTF